MEQAIISLANLVDILAKRMLDENNRLREEIEILSEEINRLHVNKKIEQAQQLEL